MGRSLPGLGSPGLGSSGGSLTGGFLRPGGRLTGGFLGSLGGSLRGCSRLPCNTECLVCGCSEHFRMAASQSHRHNPVLQGLLSIRDLISPDSSSVKLSFMLTFNLSSQL